MREEGHRVEVVELDERSRRSLARRHPEVSGCRAALVVTAGRDVAPDVAEAIRKLVSEANEAESLQFERLVTALTPPMPPPSPVEVERARHEAALRMRVLRDFGAHTAAEVAALGGSASGNRSQLAYRWRKQGRVFAVTHRGAALYLSFQFGADGQPLPAVADVLEALKGRRPWEVARWFVEPHGVLDRARPVDLLTDDPAAVAAAARFTARRPVPSD